MKNSDQRFENGVKKLKKIQMDVDGDKIDAYEGETVAAALIAFGIKVFGRTRKTGAPRGYYCGIGQCQSCRMTINGIPDTLACQATVSANCSVEIDKSNKS